MAIAQTLPLGFSIRTVNTTSSLSDEAVLALSAKDPGAFSVLLDRYQAQFLSRAQMVVRDRDRAEDIVQDTFVRIYRFAPHFDPKAGNFRSWALTILMNVARTHYQKNAREKGYTVALDPEHYESLADPSEGKEGDGAYAKEIIDKALAQAPEDVKQVLVLAFIEGLPHKDIGDKLGLSAAAVKTRVHRAKAVLRSIIGTVE